VSALLKYVRVAPLQPERFAAVLDAAQLAQWEETVLRARARLAGRVVWNVSSTFRGGGVAEMLSSLLAYARGGGVDARWVVIRADEGFFAITKRLHNRLHGVPGDGGPLGATEAEEYEHVCRRRGEAFAGRVAPGDIVVLHDPQTAGMAALLKERGAVVVWRAHVGSDVANGLSREAHAFLRPHVTQADACVFSRQAFVWAELEGEPVRVIEPSIDAFSAKNQDMDSASVAAVLRRAGLEAGPSPGPGVLTRLDGTPMRIDHRVKSLTSGPVPAEAAMLLQVSRWDRLKDHAGVMRAFSTGVAPHTGAHLVLAGPETEAVADDPEGRVVLAELLDAQAALASPVRERVHVACLPMRDPEENAALVNALQRRATVVAQKSLAEGFGLTVTEAMWKAKPVVASKVGGIQDQIERGRTGMLVDPTDGDEFARATLELLGDPARAAEMGRRARAHVRDRFLGPRHLTQWAELIEMLLGANP